MKRTIYKYPLELEHLQGVTMPKDATILTVQVQRGVLCLWALVNPEAPPQLREIEIFGTGLPIQEWTRSYIGTVQMQEGMLAWHVFERE